MDGAKHREQRGVMSKAFTPRFVRGLEEKFLKNATRAITPKTAETLIARI